MTNVAISFTSDERTYGGLPAQFLKNRFFERNPTQAQGAAMLARPGTSALETYGEGPIRANFSQPGLFNGALFTVSGNTLFRRDTDGTVIVVGGVVAGTGEVSMDGVSGADFEHLFLADGATLQLYNGPDGLGVHALTSVPVPDGLPPCGVATLKGHVLIAISYSDRFYWIKPGEVTIDGLDFATAESQPDDTVAVKVVGDTAFFIGEGSTEVWFPTGDLDTPFAPVNGRVFDHGGVSGTAVSIKGTVFLVGVDGIVYAVRGGSERISNHGIEQTIRSVLAVSGGVLQRSWTFDFDGHVFYVLDLDFEGSLVYDLLTGQWSRFVTEGFGGRWNLRNGFHWRSGRMVVGGGSKGDLLRLDPSLFTDIGINPGTSFLFLEGAGFSDGDLLLLEGADFSPPEALLIDGEGSPVEYEVRGILKTAGTNFLRQYSLRMIGSSGVLGDDVSPTMVMQFSDDRGETWSSEYTIALTQNTKQRIEFRSLGAFAAPGRIFRIRDTGGVQFLSSVEASIGGVDDGPPA